MRHGEEPEGKSLDEAVAGVSRPGTARRMLIDLALVALFTSLCYLPGLTTHGLTNQQESLRALAALEMHERGDRVVPTIHGHAYLDKPPVMYWVQLELARLLGTSPGETTVRLAVALFGVLGVLATYLAGRGLLADLGERRARTAALWAAALLGTGILYTRSARIGELDVLLVPPTALGVLAMHRLVCLRTASPRAVHRWIGWLGLLLVCAAAAALTKGPPGLATLLVAVPGAIVLSHLAAERSKETPSRARRRAARIAGTIAGTLVLVLRSPGAGDLNDVLGLVFFVILLAIVAYGTTIAATGPGLRTLIGRVLASGVIEAALAGGAALALWSAAAASRLGAEAVERAAGEQVAENLHLLFLGTPVRHLTTAVYGCGIGSLAALGGLALIARRRFALPPGVWVVLSWATVAFGVFLVAGRPSERYLTPIWSGTALLGGWWIATTVPWRARDRVVAAACLGLALGQLGWYAIGRERVSAHRSPRDLAAEVAADERLAGFVRTGRVATLDFWSAAWDVYAGTPATPVRHAGDIGDLVGPATPFAEFAAAVNASGERWLVLVRLEPGPGGELQPGAEVLRDTGLAVVEIVEPEADFRVDKFRTPIGLAIVGAQAGGEP